MKRYAKRLMLVIMASFIFATMAYAWKTNFVWQCGDQTCYAIVCASGRKLDVQHHNSGLAPPNYWGAGKWFYSLEEAARYTCREQ